MLQIQNKGYEWFYSLCVSRAKPKTIELRFDFLRYSRGTTERLGSLILQDHLAAFLRDHDRWRVGIP